MTTIAEAIAERFGGSGRQWEDDQGVPIDEVCWREAEDRVNTHAGSRYEFADGSAIVITETGWDIGFPGHDLDCFCWPAANGGEHLEGCPEARS